MPKKRPAELKRKDGLVLVGCWPLHQSMVQLFIDPEGSPGGYFSCFPDVVGGQAPRIVVSVKNMVRWRIHSVLLHETLEMLSCSMRTRFLRDMDIGQDMASFLFVETHEQFAERVAEASCFLTRAEPAFWKAVRRIQRSAHERTPKKKAT